MEKWSERRFAPDSTEHRRIPDERDYEIVTVVGELLQRRSRSAVVRDGPRCWCVNSVNSVIAGGGFGQGKEPRLRPYCCKTRLGESTLRRGGGGGGKEGGRF